MKLTINQVLLASSGETYASLCDDVRQGILQPSGPGRMVAVIDNAAHAELVTGEPLASINGVPLAPDAICAADVVAFDTDFNNTVNFLDALTVNTAVATGPQPTNDQFQRGNWWYDPAGPNASTQAAILAVL